MVGNKTVGGGFHIRPWHLANGRAGAYRMRPYGGRGISSGAPAPRSTTFIIYYFLFIICNR